MRRLTRALGLILYGWLMSTCGARSSLSDDDECFPSTCTFASVGAYVLPQDTCLPPNPSGNLADVGILDSKYATEYWTILRVVHTGCGCRQQRRLHLEAADVELLSSHGDVILRKDGTPARFSQPVMGDVDPYVPDQIK